MKSDSSSAGAAPQKTDDPLLAPMRSGRRPVNSWIVAVGTGVMLHAIAFALFQLPPSSPPAVVAVPRSVVWLGNQAEQIDTILGGQLALKDPTPLFLPTPWNYALPDDGGLTVRRPGDVFDYEEAKTIVERETRPPGLVALPDGMNTASEAVGRFARPYTSAFGRFDADIVAVGPRLALVEVTEVGSGEVVMMQEVAESAAPAARTWPFWAPFEMFVRVESTGVLGPPLVPAPGSGSAEVDAFFQTFARQAMRLELRLPAGYYRVVVNP